MKRHRLSQAEKRVIGTEPAFSEIEDPKDIRLIHAFNWYKESFDQKDASKHVRAYMKANRASPEDIEHFERHSETPLHVGAIARLLNGGISLPADTILSLLDHIDKVAEIPEEEEEEEPEENVQTYIKEKVSEIIGRIENILDDFYIGEYAFYEPHIYSLLRTMNAKSSQANIILRYYQPLLDEALEVYAVKTEGYEHLSKKQLKNNLAFVEAICNDLRIYATNEKQARKPRRKKEKSAVQLITKLKYAKNDDNLKISSIDPVNIIGASSLWVYNLKYRKLSRLVAASSQGLGVKGTTVINIDENESECRKLRKPEQTLKTVLEEGKVKLRTLLKSLSTKPSPITGRIGEDTIILRAIR